MMTRARSGVLVLALACWTSTALAEEPPAPTKLDDVIYKLSGRWWYESRTTERPVVSKGKATCRVLTGRSGVACAFKRLDGRIADEELLIGWDKGTDKIRMLSVNSDAETRLRVCDFADDALICEPTTSSVFEGTSRETTLFRFEGGAITVVTESLVKGKRLRVETIATRKATKARASAKATPPSRPPATPAIDPSVKPPPPVGTILPRVGTLASAKEGYENWSGIVEVRAGDPEVQRSIAAARAKGVVLDPGDAGLALYADQLRAAGIQPERVSSTYFRWTIPGTKKLVHVQSHGPGATFDIDASIL
jgi:hypothetical protein